MAELDTETMLEIIQMIRQKKEHIKNNRFEISLVKALDQTVALDEFEEHLQSCIEARLNAAENKTEE